MRRAMAAVVLLAAPACSFSSGVGGLNYEGLEAEIADSLDVAYADAAAVTFDGVSCPPPEQRPAAGDRFLCSAAVGDQRVRVEVEVTADSAADDDLPVTFRTLDLVYDVAELERSISADASERSGVAVTVTCPGTPLRVIPLGGSFDCSGVDQGGAQATIRVQADDVGETSWDVVG